MGRNWFLLVLFLVVLIGLVSASSVAVWQGQYYTGTTFNTGTYTFNFTVYDALTGGNACFTNIVSLTTGNWGEWKTEQSPWAGCNNASQEYFLNINIDGTDETPRRRLTVSDFLRRDVETIKEGNLNVSKNVSAQFFFGDGSLLTGVSGSGNSSWNESYASTLYYSITNPSNYWNETYATFNKTYADNLYYVKNNSLQLGTQDAFGRNQIWNFLPSSILRLGSLASEGDATTVSSEGIVVYGPNLEGANMTSTNYSYARIKPMRFGLYNSLTAVSGYYFEVNPTSFYLKNGSVTKTFEVMRETGSINSLGNVTATRFIGDGSSLTNLPTSNLTNYALRNQSETFEGGITVNGDGNFSGTVYAHNFSGNSPITFVSGNTTLLIINDSGITAPVLINATEIVVSGNVETDLIKVRSGIKELTSDLALSKLDYAEDTANATLTSQQNYALKLIEVDKNISLATVGESLELKRERVITAAELAKGFIEYNSDVARLKILEAKNLALLNILNPADEAVVEAAAAARLIELNLTAQNQSAIVEDALNDSLQEIEANDSGIRFCLSDGTNCNSTFVGNVSAQFFFGDGSLLTGVNGDNSSWNESYANTLYYAITNPFGFYNLTSFDIGNYFTSAQISGFNYYNSTYFSIGDYYLNSNPFGFYNSTTLPPAGSEVDPLWGANFSLYNLSWSSTYNLTYDTWAYNQTTSAINKILSFDYYNSTSLISNSQLANGNNYWNDTYATFNKTYADTLYAGIGVAGDNSSWNESYANTKYLNLSGTNANQNVNISPYNFESANLTLTKKITFSFGQVIDNVVNGWIKITGGLNVTGDSVVAGNITAEGIILEQDTTNHRIYDNSTCVIIRGDTSTMYIC